MDRVLVEGYDFFAVDDPSELELNEAAVGYVEGRCSLDEVRRKFRAFVEAHKIKTTLFE